LGLLLNIVIFFRANLINYPIQYSSQVSYMNELDQINGSSDYQPIEKIKHLTSLEVYDKYGAMAYGIILQIIPQPHLAQEVLVNVFSSPQLQSCNSYPFTFAVCVIKLARAKAVETKRKLLSSEPKMIENNSKLVHSPDFIFDLAFCGGYTPEEIAGKLNISKSDVLKAFHDFFKSKSNS